jgi:plasmid stability protein
VKPRSSSGYRPQDRSASHIDSRRYSWYHLWYRLDMAMTLRLDEQETDALRQRAEREGRSMQEVARQAVRDYIERTSKRELLDQVLDRELPRYAEALERLGR